MYTGFDSSSQPAKEYDKLVVSLHPVWILPFLRQLLDIYRDEVEISTE